MKKYTVIFRNAIAIALFTVVFYGCKKEEKLESSDTESSSDHSLAEAAFNDVANIADEAADSGVVSSYKRQNSNQVLSVLSNCSMVTRDTVSNPHLITVDFGINNCVGADGKNRRGKILISYTGKYKDAGTVIHISFDNYFVNDNQLAGTKTITNNGLNAAGHISYSIKVDGNIILANNGGVITWVSDRTREWLEGYATDDRKDDVYSITGNGSGVSARGISYTALIINPLIKKMASGCKHFVSGSIEITPKGKLTRTIDFGGGGCDDEATVTVGKSTRTITLK